MKEKIRLQLSKDDALFVSQALNLVIHAESASKDAKTKAYKLMVRIADNLI